MNEPKSQFILIVKKTSMGKGRRHIMTVYYPPDKSSTSSMAFSFCGPNMPSTKEVITYRWRQLPDYFATTECIKQKEWKSLMEWARQTADIGYLRQAHDSK